MPEEIGTVKKKNRSNSYDSHPTKHIVYRLS